MERIYKREVRVDGGAGSEAVKVDVIPYRYQSMKGRSNDVRNARLFETSLE